MSRREWDVVLLSGLGAMLILIIAIEVPAQRKVSEEAQIFQDLKNGVFVIFGDESQGSGFLIDSVGLVVTNHHVVANSFHIKVGINDSTIVPANLLVQDAKKDIAILQVNPLAVCGLPALSFRFDTVDYAMEGETVLAIGSPLHQSRILTTGIVSKLEPEVIISDVNINHGNSGGPLINLDKQVIGINTFGDWTSSGGPGISGIVRTDRCFHLIDSARAMLASTPAPEMRLLPVVPKTPFPMAALKALPVDQKLNAKPYQMSKSGFNIEVQTPPFNYWRHAQYTERLAKDRKKRESKGNADEKEKLGSRNNPADWYKYTGEDYPPVVVINVIPKVGEKKGSIWGNLLGAAVVGGSYRGTHTMEFKGDLKNMVLLKDGQPVEEILRGMSFVSLDFFEATWGANYKGQDLARTGQFLFPFEVFRPTDSVWPAIQMVITKIDKPDDPDTIRLSDKTIKQVWHDFEPCYDMVKLDSMVKR